ncbi:hypothetical protein AB6A23_06665 [Paenibacillus tarimensis]
MNNQSVVHMNTFKVASDQLDQISDVLQSELKRKQRALKVKEFLKCLAADPEFADLQPNPNSRSLSEWLYIAEYPIKQEMIYSYEKRRFESSNRRPVIDLAELLTMLLKKQGVNYTFEDLMDHVLAGGALADFLCERETDKAAAL